jgi:8-oxo-dGTP diphosphatase
MGRAFQKNQRDSKMALVTAALIQKDGTLLIAQRGRGKRFGWQWEFPGGKVRKGEAPEECLRREIKEELNLDIHVEKLFCTVSHRYADFDIELMVFWCSIAGGTLKLAEHEKVHWVTLSALKQYRFLEADLAVIEALADGPFAERSPATGFQGIVF